ncbi:Dihydroxyacetone phosphate acyltransferase [Strongyloides ratti]|uniref:Dihydroxyacetone phosphate acyltransferase n=1 Tax=Strongyloides ratti TaxID=34506 RepID=A0A090KNW1_STRRB|nr:Dihydroxyacetone phosphate acyltransferase [Strongyloides ratti]CEF59268.1 Dihydroxyacetone phosphate acyltransferase [Strongyloides ratti]
MENNEKFKKEYINILEILRNNGGPFNWIWKKRNFSTYSDKFYQTKVGKDKIIKNIIESENVSNVINEICKEKNIKIENVKIEAYEILINMKENFNIYVTRIVGYSFMKIFNNVLKGVYINSKEIEEIKKLIKSHPIVFMPTHKSYLDFLLLSIICYDQDLTLPAIAAGMDFQNSFLIGETLRLCGAFYLKRTFGKDKLYWSIFSEYVKTFIHYPDKPFEFFVEGTRSRTQKSLFPKYGLFQMVIEPFLKNDVYDIQIIPVSINYDRIMEEILYGYELLGFPKPKESTSSLIKSRSILNESYGNVYMTFGKSISIRNCFNNKINRINISSLPKLYTNFGNNTKYQIKKLAHIIIKKHNENSITTIFPIITFTIMQILKKNDSSVCTKILYEDLYENVLMYYNLLKQLNINIIFEKDSLDSEIRYQLFLHKNLFVKITMDIFERKSFEISLSNFDIDKKVQVKKIIPDNSVVYIILQNYTNQLLHHFIDIIIFGIIFIENDNYMGNGGLYENIYEDYVKIKKLFRYEFVYIIDEEKVDFEKTILKLIKLQIIKKDSNNIIKIINIKLIQTLTKLIESFIDGYILLTKIIKQISGQFINEKELLSLVQLQIGKEIRYNNYKFIQNINTDFIKNVISTLKYQHILVKYSYEKEELLSINNYQITKLINFFGKIFVSYTNKKKDIYLEDCYGSNNFISSKI